MAVCALGRPLEILDVGGTAAVWQSMGLANACGVRITLLNVAKQEVSDSNITSMVGDGRNMNMFTNAQFDVVYCNSVIEHVGNIEDMQRMAEEIRRVGRSYFLQTPYKYFPIEPHFVFPLFQFLPIFLRIFLVQHFSLAWTGRIPDRDVAERAVKSIVLLSKTELRSLFPDADITAEKFFGLPKSLLAQTI
jgi:2-polyprenyl-3-methyl-5-hydroxy-6-metoxy-1,4-benzoquinol methylase